MFLLLTFDAKDRIGESVSIDQGGIKKNIQCFIISILLSVLFPWDEEGNAIELNKLNACGKHPNHYEHSSYHNRYNPKKCFGELSPMSNCT